MSVDDPGWRVKVYQLDSDGQWNDNGTGHVIRASLESGTFALVVKSEDDDTLLLNTTIVEEDIYQRQGETIITWGEPDNKDKALSFEQVEGCQDIWDKLCFAQGRMPGIGAPPPASSEQNGGVPLELPEPTLSNLAAIREAVETVSPMSRQLVASAILKDECSYLFQLVELFTTCEDLEQLAPLTQLYFIFKAIVMLNDPSLLEVLFMDTVYPHLVGVLEYDPGVSIRQRHRVFLSEKVVFKQVVPLDNQEVLERIHQNFRIEYLKDVVLARVLDDATFATLNSLHFFNTVALVTDVHHDSEYLAKIFTVLQSTTAPLEQRSQAVTFVHTLCDLAKPLQPQQKKQFFESLCSPDTGLLTCMEQILGDLTSTTVMRMGCTEILMSILVHDASLLRNFLLATAVHPPSPDRALVAAAASVAPATAAAIAANTAAAVAAATSLSGIEQPESVSKLTRELCSPPADQTGTHGSLLRQLLLRLILETDLGVQAQVADLLRILVDPETMESPTDRDVFLNMFYDHYVPWMVLPLSVALPQLSPEVKPATAIEREKAALAANEARKQCLSLVCSLLSLCVTGHGYHIKYFALRQNLTSKLLQLTAYREKHLQLSAIRFVRVVVGLKDSFYHRDITKHNLFAPIFDLFQRNGLRRDNLINSAILELMDFILKNKIKLLVTYSVENFGELFKRIDYVDTFSQLILCHKQNTEIPATASGPDIPELTGTAAAAQRRRSQQLQEEAYFDGSDEEDTASDPAPDLSRDPLLSLPNRSPAIDLLGQYDTSISESSSAKAGGIDEISLPDDSNNDSTECGVKGSVPVEESAKQDRKHTRQSAPDREPQPSKRLRT